MLLSTKAPIVKPESWMGRRKWPPSLHRAPRWSRISLPQVMFLEAVTKFWFPRNLWKSASPSPGHTQGCTSGPLWRWPRDSSWPMSGEHSDQVTHRLGKLTARARPLPKLFFFLPGPWWHQRGQTPSPRVTRRRLSPAPSHPLGTCSLSKESALMVQAS